MRGTPEGLAEFLRKRLDTTYRLAAVILREPTEAEEATAAAFATAWRRSWRLSPGEDTDAWLQQILVAACRDRWRRLHWVEPEVPTAQPGPRRDRFPHAAERDALLRAIAQVAPEERTHLALRAMYALTDAQIAERTGQSEAMVRLTLDATTSQLWLAYNAATAAGGEGRGEGRAEDRFDQDLPAIVRGMAPAMTPPALKARVDEILGQGQPGRLAEAMSRAPVVPASIGAVLLAAIVIAALTGRTAPTPAGRGPIGSSAPPGGNPGSPASSAVPGELVPQAGWSEKVIGESSQGMQVLGWSPDDGKVAVKGFTANGASILQIFDRTGKLLRTIPASPAGWISLAGWADDDHLITATYTLPGAAAPVWLRSAQGQTDTLLGSAPGDIIFGSGSVAVVMDSAPASFVIWHGGTFSKPITGWPLAWSGDGRTLAFLGDLGGVGPWSRRGTLRLVDRDSYAVRDLGVSVDSAFVSVDEDGGRLLVCRPSSESAPGCSPTLVDVSSGSAHSSAHSTELPSSVTAVAWTDDGAAAFYVGGTVYQWRVGSEPVAMDWQPDSGNGIVGLMRVGNGIAVFLPDGPAVPERVAGSQPPILLIPGSSGPDGSGAATRNGTRVVYTRTLSNGHEELVLATIAPSGFGLPPVGVGVPPPS
jgi:DNA-directed RNA polymerase specialized sigma24 family protein